MHPLRALLSTLALMVVSIDATPSRAAWGSEPSLILAEASDQLSSLTAVTDGGTGWLLFWSQRPASGQAIGALRVQHVLADGTPDPAWPTAGRVIGSLSATHKGTTAISDGVGGAYLHWTATDSMFASRITHDGEVSPGWSASGRFVGLRASTWAAGSPVASTSKVLAPVTGGIVFAWITGGSGQTRALRLQQLAPDGTIAAGWPAQGRVIATPDPLSEWILSFDVALAEGGGLWASWGRFQWSEESGQLIPSEWQVQRLGPSGLSVGPVLSAGSLRSDLLEFRSPLYSNVAISDDGAGGFYHLRFDDVAGCEAQGSCWEARLYRFASDGSLLEWPTEGEIVDDWPMVPELTSVAPLGLTPLPTGVIVRTPHIFSHGLEVSVGHWPPAPGWGNSAAVPALEFGQLAHASGEVWLSSWKAQGPYGPYDSGAYLAVSSLTSSGSRGAGSLEHHSEPHLSWFGGAALALAPETGAVFFWSQVRERFGIFARRFAISGEVTSVPGTAVPHGSMRLRHVRGRGVVATLTGGATLRLQLWDVSGRRVAQARALPEGEHVVAGTEDLEPGLYFARALAHDGAPLHARVAVLR